MRLRDTCTHKGSDVNTFIRTWFAVPLLEGKGETSSGYEEGTWGLTGCQAASRKRGLGSAGNPRHLAGELLWARDRGAKVGRRSIRCVDLVQDWLWLFPRGDPYLCINSVEILIISFYTKPGPLGTQSTSLKWDESGRSGWGSSMSCHCGIPLAGDQLFLPRVINQQLSPVAVKTDATVIFPVVVLALSWVLG